MLTHLFTKPLFRDTFFVLVLLIVMGSLRWDSQINHVAEDPNLWRQSDCVAITHYYAEGTPFLEPEMYARISDNGRSGKTVAECPILYYIIGKIWSVTGERMWIYRGFNGLLCIVALLCLYRMLLRLTKNWFWSALGPLLLLASPIYAYYGISFITNMPALNCILIAWYFIGRYYFDAKTKYLLWAAALFALAGLLKVSSMTSYLILLFILLLDISGFVKFKTDRKFFPKPFAACAILIVPMVLVLLWYLGYAEYYTELHGGRYSVNAPQPIWDFSPEQRAHVWEMWFGYTSLQIYPAYLWYFFIGTMLFLIAQWKKVNPFWRITMPLMLIGHSLFALLFFFSLDGHDYYHIDLLFFFIITYIALAKFISSRETAGRRKMAIRVAAVLIMTWSILGSANNMDLRLFGKGGRETYSTLFNNDRTIEFFAYFHREEWLRRPYAEIADELTNRGFDENTVVYAVNDISFNSLLVRLRRPGFTGLFEFVLDDSAETMLRIERGAELMMVEDPEKEWRRGLTKFLEYPLFKVGRVGVYDLRPYRKRLPGVEF